MTKFLTLDDIDFKDKTVLVRVDFNSPVDPETKMVLDDTRIRAHADTTIKELLQSEAKVVILAHQSRLGEPDFIPLKQHAKILGEILGTQVKYVNDVFGDEAQNAVKELKSGEILILDNVRTFPDEIKKGKPEEHSKTEFVRNLAPLADVFVNDTSVMRYQHNSNPLFFVQSIEHVIKMLLSFRIHTSCRLIQEKNLRLVDNCPCNKNPLLLAS